MPTGLGATAKCGIKATTAWNEAWSAVDTLLPFTEESTEQVIEEIENLALEGTAGKRASDQGLIKITSQLKGALDYYNWGIILEAAMGNAAAGVYTIVDNLAKIFHIEFEKQVSRWRLYDVMVDVLEISGVKGKHLEIAVNLACRKIERSATAFPSISITNRSKVKYSNSSSNSRIRIADLVDALGSGDEIGWESFVLRMNRNLKTDDYTNQQREILQPVINGFREVSLTFKDPRYTADTIPGWKDAGTALQADLYFTDGTKKCHIEIPEMKIFEGFDAPVPGPEVLVLEGPASCFINTNNVNMSGISNEFRITIANA